MKNKSDYLRLISTVMSALLVFVSLIAILVYVFSNGIKTLSWKLITSDYYEEIHIVKCSELKKEFTNPQIENTYFSKKYGIALKDDLTIEGNKCITVAYVSIDSPFNNIKEIDQNVYAVKTNDIVDILMGTNNENNDIYCDYKSGAEEFAKKMDEAINIDYLQFKKMGGGIRGSLITTLYLIFFSLLFSIPLGICGAIYLVLYAKEGKFKTIISSMIDSTSGIPSIIFGFVGMIVFIPIVSLVSHRNDYSIIAGALTMTLILLPVIIKTTCEALTVVPKEYMENSLALGASKTQSIFKVILPNALPGILTSVILSIGRIIGESAALIFVMGTFIKDDVKLLNGATSLSLHIFSLTKADVPNYNVACAISIIILIIVFTLNIIVKIINVKINKKRGL